ncbi:MAG: hypothetical protein IPN71_00045 [Fibrobacteres bacterium]|nr:hypothetical protein [Fibrobacterota bacterium]
MKTYRFTDKSGSYQAKFSRRSWTGSREGAAFQRAGAPDRQDPHPQPRDLHHGAGNLHHLRSGWVLPFPKLLDVDIDGDGLVDPIVVFRFCEKDGNGGYDGDP